MLHFILSLRWIILLAAAGAAIGALQIAEVGRAIWPRAVGLALPPGVTTSRSRRPWSAFRSAAPTHQ